ncbi:uncharacterized protein G2W53_024814 [Senna tora]|uniref:Uncharacterized protein n=1 Tax=Senna tora TaxID=362788 RepID=A0A834TKT6_9FABA|nr:uncharacterized protein G2W53_024814 [Senna tora]
MRRSGSGFRIWKQREENLGLHGSGRVGCRRYEIRIREVGTRWRRGKGKMREREREFVNGNGNTVKAEAVNQRNGKLENEDGAAHWCMQSQCVISSLC